MGSWTIRVRLTLLYGALVLASGIGLLALTYLFQERVVSARLNDSVVTAQVAAESATSRGAGPGAVVHTRDVENKKQRSAVAAEVREEFRHEILPPLLKSSAQAIGVFAVGGLAIGWVVSGRTLRPVRRITAAAQQVAAGSLDQRIALTGPADELRELADTFDAMLARLEAAFDIQRRFVANAAHELKTPLAINRTLIEVAMNRPGSPAEVARLGSSLLEVNRRHEALIDGLLALARSEQRVADPIPVELGDLLLAAADGVAAEADRRGVALQLEPGPAPLAGDPALLERLIQNLLQNGVRYNVPGGFVQARTSVVDGEVRLTVANSGPLIEPADVPALFQPFRRLADRVGSADGSGLGLSIVRAVARMHGGEATATARPDGGLLAEILLPGLDRRPGEECLSTR